MVADDVRQPSQLGVGLHTYQVVEPLVALGGLRRFVGRQHGGKLGGQPVGVDHLALGVARVYADAPDGNLGRGSVEVLKLQLAHVAAIHRVGPLAAEPLDVEVMGTHAYLLVGVEGYADLAVAYLLVVAQVAHGLYNLGYARLVVGT